MSTINSQNEQITEQFFTTNDIGKVFSWDAVLEIHKTRNGIYQKNGQLISLLTDFGKINECYPDFHGETTDTIFYTGAGKRGNQKLDIWNKALHNAIKTELTVPLFCKLRVNQWQFLGFWQVCDAEYIFEPQSRRNIWSFVLKKNDLQEF
ncbi:MAG TPA: hypothetical protein PKE69_25160 [Pyrinomonadaceae bacterium]|nr:hypothetical protein [Pyrinomonadaceae bacterium]